MKQPDYDDVYWDGETFHIVTNACTGKNMRYADTTLFGYNGFVMNCLVPITELSGYQYVRNIREGMVEIYKELKEMLDVTGNP